MNIGEFKSTLNAWGQDHVPFLFVVDFEMEKPLAWPVSEVDASQLLFDFSGFTNAPPDASSGKGPANMDIDPIPFPLYREKFDKVMHRLCYGDSFLTNLTIKTRVRPGLGLRDLFYRSSAPYKMWLENAFLVFSPEPFIQVRDGIVFAYPMKGTIEAGLTDAEKRILSDAKELAEHVTIVDLIRNDLSMVATRVQVKKFRYVEEVRTNQKNLLQVSSEIVGELMEGFPSRIGDVIASMLPAGSVSGAPKQKTVEVIQAAEGEKRGYYSGVCGYFDGRNLDSGVMIRFIEQSGDQYYYRSGGGITTQSGPVAEYKEALAKIYVPVT